MCFKSTSGIYGRYGEVKIPSISSWTEELDLEHKKY